MRKFRILAIIMAMFFVAGMVGCTASIGQVPFAKWTSYQKANFFMKTWENEKASYDSLNAMENKPPDLIVVLNAKYKIIEKSRIPVRMYVKIVKAGGIPDSNSEQEILDWIRDLQQQLVYGGGL